MSVRKLTGACDLGSFCQFDTGRGQVDLNFLCVCMCGCVCARVRVCVCSEGNTQLNLG